MRNALLFMGLSAGLAMPAQALGQDTIAAVTLCAGDCRIRHGAESDEADIDRPLYAGDSVLTGRNSRIEIGFGDGSRIRLAENTRFMIRRAGADRSFHLAAGKCWASVTKLAERARFEVTSPTAVAGVRGTVFKVEAGGDSTSRVAVEEGEVELHNPLLPGRQVRLAARQEAFVRRRADPTAPRAFDPDRQPRWERFTRRMFHDLAKSARGLSSGAVRVAQGHEKLVQSARNLLARAGREPPGHDRRASELARLQRAASENQRSFRLLSLRAERRFRQAAILGRRIEEPGDAAALAAEVDDLKSGIDRASERFEAADAPLSSLLAELEQILGNDAPGDGPIDAARALARLRELEGRAALPPAEVDRIGRAESAMSEFLREAAAIRALAPSRPLLAGEQLSDLRRRFALFKQASGSFAFPALERLLSEARAAGSEARRLAAGLAGDAGAAESSARVTSSLRSASSLWQRALRLARQGQSVERMMLEADAIIKNAER